ncbi:hypothetical protein GCM10027079_01060 [Sediminivirga luteola]|uniref:Uncharacterized protein n=1 Tax=Sediminivirga luteola TaxID=1774748 RepID=A0A8J2U094_9MICO|nr:hypothetical protein GCM10011333_29000 [Sediminivirga luteola]
MRELLLMVAGLLAIVPLVSPIMRFDYLGNTWIWGWGSSTMTVLFLGVVPLLATAVLTILGKTAGIKRIGSFSVDQTASALALVSFAVSFIFLITSAQYWHVGMVFLFLAGLLAVFAATLTMIPFFSAELEARPGVDAHPKARPAVVVKRSPAPAAPVQGVPGSSGPGQHQGFGSGPAAFGSQPYGSQSYAAGSQPQSGYAASQPQADHAGPQSYGSQPYGQQFGSQPGAPYGEPAGSQPAQSGSQPEPYSPQYGQEPAQQYAQEPAQQYEADTAQPYGSGPSAGYDAPQYGHDAAATQHSAEEAQAASAADEDAAIEAAGGQQAGTSTAFGQPSEPAGGEDEQTATAAPWTASQQGTGWAGSGQYAGAGEQASADEVASAGGTEPEPAEGPVEAHVETADAGSPEAAETVQAQASPWAAPVPDEYAAPQTGIEQDAAVAPAGADAAPAEVASQDESAEQGVAQSFPADQESQPASEGQESQSEQVSPWLAPDQEASGQEAGTRQDETGGPAETAQSPAVGQEGEPITYATSDLAADQGRGAEPESHEPTQVFSPFQLSEEARREVSAQETAPDQQAVPAQAEPEPVQQEAQAPVQQAFWFAVPEPRPAFDPHTGEQLYVIQPGAWFLALQDHGDRFTVRSETGQVAELRDVSGIQRG